MASAVVDGVAPGLGAAGSGAKIDTACGRELVPLLPSSAALHSVLNTFKFYFCPRLGKSGHVVGVLFCWQPFLLISEF